MVDLAVCVEGIRRALVYGIGIEEYRERPRKVGSDYARISTEGFVEAVRAIAENCPLPEWKKEDLLERYRRWKNSPWQTIAKYALTPAEISHIPDEALEYLRDYLGYNPEEYEKYIP